MHAAQAGDRRFRYIAIVAVVVLHAVLLLLAQRMSNVAHRVDDIADRALVWLRIDRPKPRPREQTPTPEPRLSIPSTEVVAPTLPDVEATDEPSRPTSLPPRQIDWRANAARSAEKIVGSTTGPSYQSFGPRKPVEPGEAPPPSVFTDTPKHKYGDIDKDVGGDPIVWTSDNCYTELDKLVQTASDYVNAGPGSFSAPKIRCLGRGAAGNDHLFDHLKKREEPPVPKAGTEMNALPEREADGESAR